VAESGNFGCHVRRGNVMRSRPRAREPYIRCTQGAQNHPDHYECERAKQVGPDRREDRNRPRPRSPNFQIAGVALRPRSRWPRRSCCPLDGQSNPFLCDGLPALHARDRHHRANSILVLVLGAPGRWRCGRIGFGAGGLYRMEPWSRLIDQRPALTDNVCTRWKRTCGSPGRIRVLTQAV
jgi:hypothetical protein